MGKAKLNEINFRHTGTSAAGLKRIVSRGTENIQPIINLELWVILETRLRQVIG